MTPDETRPKVFSCHPEVACWTYRLWRACGLEDPQKPLFNFRFAESRKCPWLLRSFLSDRVWCVGAVAGFCAILPVLGVVHSSLWPSELSSEASLSSGNAKSLLGSPIHIKYSNTSYIQVGEPSTETLPSGHHKYTSRTCCIEAYSAAALGFRRFLSCGQRVQLEWTMLVSIMQQQHLETQLRRVYKSSPFLRVMFDSKCIHQAIYIVTEYRVIFLFEESDDWET